ncbi:restriction endonuclease [Xanthomonas cannabis]|uniref:restriction endonuclease n=1 Tax=Xanthomonas cannabis TaxID=1885674 RepID=UPI0033AB2BC9
MPKLNFKDIRLVDLLFRMEGGYVLDFSNRTFSEFFSDELDLDIDDARYLASGGSKANRLRTFLAISEPHESAKALRALWVHRSELIEQGHYPDDALEMKPKFDGLLHRVSGGGQMHAGLATPRAPALPIKPTDDLRTELLAIRDMVPQARGYEFERFLNKIFSHYGLDPRNPFRNAGEQIDGSFQLQGHTYLVEAKWKGAKTGAADLHVLEGKLSLKAAWARGLFISFNGFTDDGLQAFNGPKRVVCMEGRDLWDLLNRGLLLPEVLEKKIRHAAETGECFCPVSSLFP